MSYTRTKKELTMFRATHEIHRIVRIEDFEICLKFGQKHYFRRG